MHCNNEGDGDDSNDDSDNSSNDDDDNDSYDYKDVEQPLPKSMSEKAWRVEKTQLHFEKKL